MITKEDFIDIFKLGDAEVDDETLKTFENYIVGSYELAKIFDKEIPQFTKEFTIKGEKIKFVFKTLSHDLKSYADLIHGIGIRSKLGLIVRLSGTDEKDRWSWCSLWNFRGMNKSSHSHNFSQSAIHNAIDNGINIYMEGYNYLTQYILGELNIKMFKKYGITINFKEHHGHPNFEPIYICSPSYKNLLPYTEKNQVHFIGEYSIVDKIVGANDNIFTGYFHPAIKKVLDNMKNEKLINKF